MIAIAGGSTDEIPNKAREMFQKGKATTRAAVHNNHYFVVADFTAGSIRICIPQDLGVHADKQTKRNLY
jgi:hypothetical protein